MWIGLNHSCKFTEVLLRFCLFYAPRPSADLSFRDTLETQKQMGWSGRNPQFKLFLLMNLPFDLPLAPRQRTRSSNCKSILFPRDTQRDCQCHKWNCWTRSVRSSSSSVVTSSYSPRSLLYTTRSCQSPLRHCTLRSAPSRVKPAFSSARCSARLVLSVEASTRIMG
jgi:hypothetical protein